MTTSLRKVLVMGGGGQLSQAMSHHDDCTHFNILFLNKTQCDITNPTAVQDAILHHQPHVMINTAAYTKVDLAETETDAAMQVNLAGAMNLAKQSHAHNIPLIHLSTDYVFSGDSHTPYSEEDSVNPINFYGQSKWAGEVAVREYHEQHIILRVSGIFSELSHNFFNTMTRLFFEKESLRVVSDQFTCPTSAHDIASCLFRMLRSEKRYGTYHYASAEPCSWHAFANAIYEETKQFAAPRVKLIEKISSQDYLTAAKRPRYSVLNCKKIEADYHILQPDWRDAVRQLLKKKYSS